MYGLEWAKSALLVSLLLAHSVHLYIAITQRLGLYRHVQWRSQSLFYPGYLFFLPFSFLLFLKLDLRSETRRPIATKFCVVIGSM